MLCTHPGCDVDHDAPAVDDGIGDAIVAAAEVDAEARNDAEQAYTEREADANDTREHVAQIEADAAVEQTRIIVEGETEQAQIIADAMVDAAVVESDEGTEVETETETEPAADTPPDETTTDDAAAGDAASVEIPPQVEDEKSPAQEARARHRGSKFSRRHRR